MDDSDFVFVYDNLETELGFRHEFRIDELKKNEQSYMATKDPPHQHQVSFTMEIGSQCNSN